MKNEMSPENISNLINLFNEGASIIADDSPLGEDLHFESVELSRTNYKEAAKSLLRKDSLSSEEVNFLRKAWFIPKTHHMVIKDAWNCTPKDHGYWSLSIDKLNALTRAVDEICLKEISPIDRYPESKLMKDGLARIRKFFEDPHYMAWSNKEGAAHIKFFEESHYC